MPKLTRGDDRKVNITVTDSSGQPIDITGCKVYLTLNAAESPASDDDAVLKKSTTVHTDPVNGKTSIMLTHEDTDTIEPDDYWYDVQLVDAFGQVVSKKKARITVESDTTRTH